ncbi:hypothetical protein BJV77DRAFT_148678 [Russula vinacea]|nr:hypothetical protein BJV77DRAFT_148678 [Russula vinacea]
MATIRWFWGKETLGVFRPLSVYRGWIVRRARNGHGARPYLCGRGCLPSSLALRFGCSFQSLLSRVRGHRRGRILLRSHRACFLPTYHLLLVTIALLCTSNLSTLCAILGLQASFAAELQQDAMLRVTQMNLNIQQRHTFQTVIVIDCVHRYNQDDLKLLPSSS